MLALDVFFMNKKNLKLTQSDNFSSVRLLWHPNHSPDMRLFAWAYMGLTGQSIVRKSDCSLRSSPHAIFNPKHGSYRVPETAGPARHRHLMFNPMPQRYRTSCVMQFTVLLPNLHNYATSFPDVTWRHTVGQEAVLSEVSPMQNFKCVCQTETVLHWEC